MNKLIVCVMGDNCAKFLDMCFDSVLDADKIIFCWGMEDQPTKDLATWYKEKYPEKFEIIENKYNQEDRGQNGKQRQFYLDYLKKNYMNEYVLCLDADEVLDKNGVNKIKKFISEQNASTIVYSVHMRHLMFFLNWEDSNVERHYVLHRLFKVEQHLIYPEVEHPILSSTQYQMQPGKCDATTIWHCAYIPGLWDIKRRYENHLAKSNMHTPEYLRQWRNAHLFGDYPRKQFDPKELPDQILEKFGISRDELYFENRKNLEPKHIIDAYQWRDFFQPKKVLLCGDGMGQRTLALRSIGVDAEGFDKSAYAVKNSPYGLNGNITRLWIRDIAEPMIEEEQDTSYSLVVAYDVLEHLSYEDLDKALRNCSLWSSKWLLVSVPVKGDPNLEADFTHLIKEERSWWVEQIEKHGFHVIETPQNFIFRNQLIIAEKKA